MISRGQFIGRLSTLFGVWLLPSVSRTMASSSVSEDAELLKGFVAGYQYWEGHGKKLKFQRGEKLKLLREPANKYDKYAIEVFKGTLKIGYLPRYENRVLAGLMDAGYTLSAIVKSQQPEMEDIGQGVSIGVGIKKMPPS